MQAEYNKTIHKLISTDNIKKVQMYEYFAWFGQY